MAAKTITMNAANILASTDEGEDTVLRRLAASILAERYGAELQIIIEEIRANPKSFDFTLVWGATVTDYTKGVNSGEGER